MSHSKPTNNSPIGIISIISLNVNYVQPGNKRYPKLVSYLSTLITKWDPDVICFQEIGKTALQSLSTDLQLPYYKWTPYGYMGVGTISKYPLITIADVRLENRPRIIPRSAQILQINREDTTHLPNVIICNMHLCHQKESNRIYQLATLKDFIKSTILPRNPEFNVDFMIGDFNAVQLSDYTAEELEKIQESRQAFALEPAKGDLTSQIVDMGYHIPQYVGATCPYNTRVDYICTSQSIYNTINNDDNMDNDNGYKLEYIVDRESLDKKHTDHCTNILRITI